METENQTNEHGDQSGAVPRPEPFTPQGSQVQVGETSGAQGQTQKTYNDSGWSWGGFAFNLMFAIATRNYVYLWLLFLMIVPFVNIFAMLGIMIFFGIKGRELARTSTTFSNHDQYLGFMKGLDHAGKILMYFYLTCIAVGILGAGIVIMSLGGARDRAEDTYMRYEQQQQDMQYRMTEDKYMREEGY